MKKTGGFKIPTKAKRFKGGQATIARVSGNKLFDAYLQKRG